MKRRRKGDECDLKSKGKNLRGSETAERRRKSGCVTTAMGAGKSKNTTPTDQDAHQTSQSAPPHAQIVSRSAETTLATAASVSQTSEAQQTMSEGATAQQGSGPESPASSAAEPDAFKCPLTKQLMVDPVVDPEVWNYDSLFRFVVLGVRVRAN